MEANEVIEQRRAEALKKVDDEYNNLKSPHYRDNIRYKWAVNTINKACDEDKSKKE